MLFLNLEQKFSTYVEVMNYYLHVHWHRHETTPYAIIS